MPVTSGGTLELTANGPVYPQFEVMSNELNTPKILVCPSDSSKQTAFGQRLAQGFDFPYMAAEIRIIFIQLRPIAFVLLGDG